VGYIASVMSGSVTLWTVAHQAPHGDSLDKNTGVSSDKIFTVNSPFPSKAMQWKLLPSIRVHREKNWGKNGRRGC